MDKVISFRRNNDYYGIFGNMFAYPVTLYQTEKIEPTRFETTETKFRTTEALFQALRLLDYPETVQEIAEQPSPIIAKRVAKKHLAEKRPHFKIKGESDIDNMCFVVALKCADKTVWDLLKSTNDAHIIEDVGNRNDYFWGAKKGQDGEWYGYNMLGRIWMYFRAQTSQIRALWDLAFEFAKIYGPNDPKVVTLHRYLQTIDKQAADCLAEDIAIEIIGG